MLLACAVLALAAISPRARAQTDLHILHCGQDGFHSTPISGALVNLGLADQTTLVFHREDLLLGALRGQDWDLVIIRWFRAFRGADGDAIIDELEAHVARGGKLIFSMAQLDEQPGVWPLLGIENAMDVQEPLQDVISPAGISDPGGWHPAFLGIWRVNMDPFLPPTNDFGDVLVPSAGSIVVAEYAGNDTAAVLLSPQGRVMTNGPHWDYWESGTFVAQNQIEWLLFCPADLDGDGELTVFDFFEFQNRFDSGGASGFADFCYDGVMDVFDFLEYLNLFEAGC
jgi:hypothetical protein